jgi:hypothetical protein
LGSQPVQAGRLRSPLYHLGGFTPDQAALAREALLLRSARRDKGGGDEPQRTDACSTPAGDTPAPRPHCAATSNAVDRERTIEIVAFRSPGSTVSAGQGDRQLFVGAGWRTGTPPADPGDAPLGEEQVRRHVRIETCIRVGADTVGELDFVAGVSPILARKPRRVPLRSDASGAACVNDRRSGASAVNTAVSRSRVLGWRSDDVLVRDGGVLSDSSSVVTNRGDARAATYSP